MAFGGAQITRDVRVEYGGVTLASGVAATLLGPFDLLRHDKKCFTVYNQGSVTLSGIAIQTNGDPGGNESGTGSADPAVTPPPPNAGMWENYDTTSFNNLASGAVKSVQISADSHRWFRLYGVSNQTPSIVVSGYMSSAT